MTTLTGVEQHQDLASLIDLYLLRCQVEGKSPNTITAYGETLTLFERIAREEGFPQDVRAITAAYIYAYLGRIGSNGAGVRSGGGSYLARSTATFWPTSDGALPAAHAPGYVGGEVSGGAHQARLMGQATHGVGKLRVLAVEGG